MSGPTFWCFVASAAWAYIAIAGGGSWYGRCFQVAVALAFAVIGVRLNG